jgi:hypothetical protein
MGEVLYDCSEWAGETRAMLASLLDSHAIPHAWQGTTVSVRDEDEEAVDDLVEEVLASAGPALDPDAARIVYEVGTWPAALQSALAESLTVAEIPYEWDERGDLVVDEAHEDDVEAILEELPDLDDAGAVADDGLVLHEVLDRLFAASDRLARRPGDAVAVVDLDAAVGDLDQLPRPFGFEPPEWHRLLARAREVRDALVAEPGGDAAVDDAALAELASALRDLVRRYV